MKALKYLFGCALAFAALACTNKEIYNVYPDYGEDEYIQNASISSENPYFTANEDGGIINYKTKGGEVVVNVNCQTEWTVEYSNAEWLEADVDCALGTLTFTATRNTEMGQRIVQANVKTVASGTSFATISVIQNAFGTPEVSAETTEWNAPAVGALSTEIAVESNFDEWTTQTSCTWLIAEKTGSGLILTVDENPETESRSTEVILTSTDGTYSDTETIVVTQDGKAYIEVSAGTLAFYEDMEAKVGSTTIESNFDWDFSYDTSNGWFTVSRDGDTLTAIATSENESDDNREAYLTVTAGDGAENVTEYDIHVIQLGSQGSSMILIYTISDLSLGVTLPLSGEVNCTVDWGDGNSEEVTTTLPSHTYESVGEYFVTITGTVTSLASNGITDLNVKYQLTGIKQWGDLGLTSLQYAFYQCRYLDSLPADTMGAFAEVTTAEQAFARCGDATFYDGTTTYDPSTAFGLSEVPEDLFQYATKCTNFDQCFYWDYNLEAIPAGLFRNCEAAESFSSCFSWCIKVEEIPEGLLDGCPNAKDVSIMFSYMNSLQSVPADLFVNCPKITDMKSMFSACISLEYIPEGIFDKQTENTSFYRTFAECESLKYIPEGLFQYNTKCQNFNNTFYCCYEIEEVPEGIFDNMTACTTFFGAFQKCTSLKKVPAGLLKDATACTTVDRLFNGCTSLTEIPAGFFDNLPKCTTMSYTLAETGLNAAELPAGLFANCGAVTNVSYMFSGWDTLETIPDGLLDYFTAATNMSGLFSSCSNLKSIPADLFKNNPAVTNFASVFQDCPM
ncbi:MAG: hypothetical protein LUE27_04430, partial [Clostridia bacterium]|nr:hypothetical protein [Clostridia bacterium]